MRPWICVAAVSLLAASPLQASITLSLEPMSVTQADALGRARALVEAMPGGISRQRAATFLAYRLMMRGDCSRALPLLNRELSQVADTTAVDGLVTGALTGRDARCMAWVAARVDAVVRRRSLPADLRSELRFRGQTLFQLVGRTTRAADMPPADDASLDTVPDSARNRELAVGDTVVHISLADPPTRRETVLLGRLWDFRGTPLQLGLAQRLARRAASEPESFSRSGRAEVALALLAGGQRQAAEQALVDGRVQFLSLAGLDAEVALRQRDYERAATIFASNAWGTKAKSVYEIIHNRPDLLTPFVGTAIGTGPVPALDLMALSLALDRAGRMDDARRAAEAALSRFSPHGVEEEMRARALARTGDFQAARAVAARAKERPGLLDPNRLRMAIVLGAALAGNLAEVDRGLAEAPPEFRTLTLINALIAVPPTRSPMAGALEERFAADVAQASAVRLPMEAMAAFGAAGIQIPLVVSGLERLGPGRAAAAAAIRIANASRRNNHLEAAATIAEVAERLLPHGPQADAELVDLAEFYWTLGRPERAISLAMRVSHPVGRVDALSRSINPARGETRPRLTFESF